MLNTLRLALLAAAMLPLSVYAAVIPTPQVAAVSKLYEAFAYEAVVDYPVGRVFIDQTKEVLLRYITPELYELIHRDRLCAMSTHEICRLDFAPLWASQDPAGSTVNFETGPRGNTVIAHVRAGAHSTKITYSLVQTKGGWRIDDIVYDDERPTLKKILSQD